MQSDSIKLPQSHRNENQYLTRERKEKRQPVNKIYTSRNIAVSTEL